MPNYDWWEAPFYRIGLKLHNLLAGKYTFGPSRVLSREETLRQLPSMRTGGHRGGVIYCDGQFDRWSQQQVGPAPPHTKVAGARPSAARPDRAHLIEGLVEQERDRLPLGAPGVPHHLR